jgi:hypothetical protein
MALSLYDIMRPMALFGGVGGANAIASNQAASGLQHLITIVAALGAGILAVGVSQVVARQVAAWVVSRPPSRKVELLLTALYLAVFVGIVLASLGAGLCAFSLTNKT